MPGIACSQENNIDILTITGGIDDSIVETLIQTISTLRQQGSQRLLIVGREVERIQTSRMEELALPVRIFRGIGGIVAIAGFSDRAVQQLRSISWYRHLNMFHEKEEALYFLNPASSACGEEETGEKGANDPGQEIEKEIESGTGQDEIKDTEESKDH